MYEGETGMVNGAQKILVWMAGVLAAASAAAAFSSERWLAERADDSDMLRLRAAFCFLLFVADLVVRGHVKPPPHTPPNMPNPYLYLN